MNPSLEGFNIGWLSPKTIMPNEETTTPETTEETTQDQPENTTEGTEEVKSDVETDQENSTEEPIDPNAPAEGSYEEFEVQHKDIEERKKGFKKDLEELVELWRIAPDAKAEYSDHGIIVGIILIDLKYNANTKAVLPTIEDQAKMEDIMKKAIIEKGDNIHEKND